MSASSIRSASGAGWAELVNLPMGSKQFSFRDAKLATCRKLNTSTSLLNSFTDMTRLQFLFTHIPRLGIMTGIWLTSDQCHAQELRPATANPEIATLFKTLNRNTVWSQTQSIHLGFPSFHCQGMAITADRIFVSSVEILEPTVMYPQPQNGYDRSPGKGMGHVFVLDHSGTLLSDIHLIEGDKYHPGGIDYDGKHIWVPLAEYRPNSAATIFRIDAETLDAAQMFDANDHCGNVLYDHKSKLLVGGNWGSRNWTQWTLDGAEAQKWANPNFFIDYQDCQYIESGLAACSGVSNLAFPAADGGGSTTAKYELGGIDLIEIETHSILGSVPISKWSKNGHSVNRNPMKLLVVDDKLQMWVAPDDGEEPGGTDILVFEAS